MAILSAVTGYTLANPFGPERAAVERRFVEVTGGKQRGTMRNDLVDSSSGLTRYRVRGGITGS
ncbi:MAG: hypothetical protein ACXW32_06565 [Limisphaerales bacterium]